jgi:hypothetical protein
MIQKSAIALDPKTNKPFDFPTVNVLHEWDNHERQWTFAGYRCSLCFLVLKRKIELHHEVCRPLKYQTAEERDAEFAPRRLSDGTIRMPSI